MTDVLEELEDATWDLHDALMKLAVAVDPEGARERVNHLAEEVCWNTVIMMEFGFLNEVRRESRDMFAKPVMEWIGWARPLQIMEMA